MAHLKSPRLTLTLNMFMHVSLTIIFLIYLCIYSHMKLIPINFNNQYIFIN